MSSSYLSFETDAYSTLQSVTSKPRGELAPFLRKQMEKARLFVYEDATTTPSSASNATGSKPPTAAGGQAYGVNPNQEARTEDPKYLLGKYECVAIPCRA